MSNVKCKSITELRDNIYDEVDVAGITTIIRSGKFSGVFISLGTMNPKMAQRFHDIIRYNPKHGIQLLIENLKSNAE